MKNNATNKGLSNPALVAAAASPAGQRAISNAMDTQRKVTDAGIQILPWLFKTTIIVAGVYVAYRLYTKRFVSLGINPNFPAANVSDAQASAKANAIYSAMVGVGANQQQVAEQIAGLNYNGWVKVYNAFGNRQGYGGIGDSMNLVEWLGDQFNSDELNELRLLINGVF